MPNTSRETKYSGANADREIFTFPVQLTTSRIGNHTQLIHTLAICVTIHRKGKDRPGKVANPARGQLAEQGK